jgi:hypothetical protein
VRAAPEPRRLADILVRGGNNFDLIRLLAANRRSGARKAWYKAGRRFSIRF